MREQLRRSRETIEERIGMPVEAISIPYGRWNDRVLEACARSGYRRLYTSDPWLPLAERAGVGVRSRRDKNATLTYPRQADREALSKLQAERLATPFGRKKFQPCRSKD